jgi:hypothetical protein
MLDQCLADLCYCVFHRRSGLCSPVFASSMICSVMILLSTGSPRHSLWNAARALSNASPSRRSGDKGSDSSYSFSFFTQPKTAAAADTPAHLLGAFRERMAETGYVDGHNVKVVYRFAESHYDRLPELAADLVHRLVAVTATIPTALAAKAATATIPIVFGVGDDQAKLGACDQPGSARRQCDRGQLFQC